MNFRDFLSQAETIVLGHDVENVEVVLSGEIVTIKWVVGGMSGGSCWGDEPEQYHLCIKAPHYRFTNDFLMLICPDLPFSHYVNIISYWVDGETTTTYEYYGNATDYDSMTIDIKKIWEYLSDHAITL